MITIIAGSRSFDDYSLMVKHLSQIDFQITEVVSGHAYGADLLGEQWAKLNNIPIKLFLPDWSQGKKAGPIRNRQMAEYADAAVVFWDHQSNGARNMIETMRELNKRLVVVMFESR